jgi:iron complex transport system substrate-binding protein
MSLRSIAVTLAGLLLCGVAATPFCPVAGATDFTDAAGRHVSLPDPVRRVLPANPAADVLVFVVNPKILVGWSVAHPREHLPKVSRLPVTGILSPPSPTAGAAAIIRHHPDVVIDVGTVTPERAAFADQMQQQTGIPYILLDDTIIRTPATLRSIGATLGEVDRGQDLSRYARRAIETLHGRLLIRTPESRPIVYYARGSDGLETASPGTPAAEAIDEAGAINAATPLGRNQYVRVTREQLVSWNPDIIIAERPSAYDSLVRSSRHLAAVRNNKIFLMPSLPFGWIDDPVGVNRMVGLYWLSTMFYPDPTQDDVRAIVADLYDKLYGIKLTDAQVESLVRRAGVPKSEATIGMPISGLTGAPKLAMPPTPGTAPSTPGVAPPGRRGGANIGVTPNIGPLPDTPMGPLPASPTGPLPR